MPITVPPFVQYQAPLTLLRGLWNVPPKEGEYFVQAEIDWITTTNNLSAVQFSLSGNSPVAFSQICAIYCDNSRCSSDVTFLFPDSGFSVTIPANTESLVPVITNALTFFVIATTGGNVGDITIFQVCNSIPPVLALTPKLKAQVTNTNADLTVLGTTPLIASTFNGTLNSINITGYATASAAGQTTQLIVSDGAAHVLWSGLISAPNGGVNPISMQPIINTPFHGGLNLLVTPGSPALATGKIFIDVYYQAQ